MSKAGILKHKEVFDLWLQGGVVEVAMDANRSDWESLDHPSWGVHDYYRIQSSPKPKIINGRYITSPEDGTTVWFITSQGIVHQDASAQYMEKGQVSQGNLFSSKEAAELERDKRIVIQKLWACEGAVPFTLMRKNWGMHYSTEEGEWSTGYVLRTQYIGQVYFSTRVHAQAAIDTLGSELDILISHAPE